MYKNRNEMTNEEVFEAIEKAQSQLITDISKLAQLNKENEMYRMSLETERSRDINYPLGLVFNV
jgi:hypothetical protein